MFSYAKNCAEARIAASGPLEQRTRNFIISASTMRAGKISGLVTHGKSIHAATTEDLALPFASLVASSLHHHEDANQRKDPHRADNGEKDKLDEGKLNHRFRSTRESTPRSSTIESSQHD